MPAIFDSRFQSKRAADKLLPPQCLETSTKLASLDNFVMTWHPCKEPELTFCLNENIFIHS